jgi:hypothetical protein
MQLGGASQAQTATPPPSITAKVAQGRAASAKPNRAKAKKTCLGLIHIKGPAFPVCHNSLIFNALKTIFIFLKKKLEEMLVSIIRYFTFETSNSAAMVLRSKFKDNDHTLSRQRYPQLRNQERQYRHIKRRWVPCWGAAMSQR